MEEYFRVYELGEVKIVPISEATRDQLLELRKTSDAYNRGYQEGVGAATRMALALRGVTKP